MYAQNALNVDSLKNIVEFQQEDESKVKMLNLIAHELNRSNPKAALKYSYEALHIAEGINFLPGIIDALSRQCKSYIYSGNYDSAYNVCEKGIHLSDSIKDLKRLANAYANYGHLQYKTLGNVKGYENYRKSYKIYKTMEDSIGICDALNGMGVMLWNQAKYDSAIIYYLKLVKIGERIGYLDILGKAFNNLGNLYDELDEYENATYYFLESIRINEKLKNLILVGRAYNNLGNIRYENQDYDSASILFNKALEISKDANFINGIADAYIGLGNISQKKARYDKAFYFLQLSKESYAILEDKQGFILASKNIGAVYQFLGKYKKAIKIFDTCLLIAIKNNLTELKEELYYGLYINHRLNKNYEAAFDYLLNYHLLYDSLTGIEKAKIIYDLQIKYEKEKDQAQILALQNENLEMELSLRTRTNQRNIYLFTGSGTIAVILFLLIFYRHKASKDRIIAAQRIRQLKEEKKLLAARSIVYGQEEERKRIAKELHDGLGVLLSTAKMQFTTIKDKSPANRPLIDKATKLLEQAAGDVRKISHNMMPGLLTKFGLYEATEDLIEQVDETEGLNAICDINGDTKRLPENTEIMLYRIIQELVNNTIKHAQAKNIQLRMNILPKQLNITYSDDGKGFDMEDKQELKSIGLSSIQSRVKFLSGKAIIATKHGTGVKYIIEIPI